MSDSRKFLGIDMGGTNIRAAVVTPTGTVVDTRCTQLPADPQARAGAPVQIARDLWSGVDAVGLAVAGTVVGGVLTWSANLGLRDVDFATALRTASGKPVKVLNDARAAGLAEALVGAGAGAQTVLTVTVGTGIGGALVSGGRVLEGTGDAGEIGHMVIDPDGPDCTCGRRGCWERFVSGRALARAAAECYPGEQQPLDRLLAAVAAGDRQAGAVVDRAVALFELGLDNLCAVFAPDLVVLGGGVMARGGVIAQRYRAAAAGLRWGVRTRIAESRLGDTAGQIGAALAAGIEPNFDTNHLPMALS